MHLTLLMVATPIMVSWQLLQVEGVTTPALEFLLIKEETAVLEGAPEKEKLLAGGLAARVREELEAGRRPGPALTRDYLAAVGKFPRVSFLRGWLRLPTGDVVEARYLSDDRSTGHALGFFDRATGEKMVLMQWLGKVDEEVREALAYILGGTNPEKREEAIETLKNKATGRISCLRVAVEAAGRIELLPCGATKKEMAEAAARLWPYLEDVARQRLGIMVQVVHSAQYSKKEATQGVLFPHFVILRALAVPPAALALTESPLRTKQLEPSNYRDLIQWELPSGERFLPFWGKKEIPATDLALSFPQLLRRYF